jgi:hypothetical protein
MAESEAEGAPMAGWEYRIAGERAPMAGWEYRIESVSGNERWTSMRHAEEVRRFVAALNSSGAENLEMVGFETVRLTGSLTGNIKDYLYLVFLKPPVRLAPPT